MSADKIERLREVLTMRISPTQFDALIAAVREDEKQKCIAAVSKPLATIAQLTASLATYKRQEIAEVRKSVTEAIKNA